ncbi:MAG: SCO family protein [Gammaproteobacteria bacterium]|nr:SCO family protein [Gammaproteobacteria bacterium]
MNNKRAVYFWIILVCFFAALWLGQLALKQQGSSLLPDNGGEFTLQSAQGPVSLSDFKGRVVAIYFGYMSCPDICPTSLWNLSSAMRLLTPEQAAQVQGVFVSLDPERDSPSAMALFVKGFYESFIGLTDSQESLDKVARQYSVVYQKVALKDSAMGYVLDHSSVIYLVDRHGVLRYFSPHNATPEEIVVELVRLLNEAD